MLWIMLQFNRNKKNPFEQELAHFKVYWDQKLTLWARDTISITHYDLGISIPLTGCVPEGEGWILLGLELIRQIIRGKMTTLSWYQLMEQHV